MEEEDEEYKKEEEKPLDEQTHTVYHSIHGDLLDHLLFTIYRRILRVDNPSK